MKTFYLETNGCSVVRHDTQRYSKYLRLNGWEEIAGPEKADLVLYTTCGVIKDTENYALQSISGLNKKIKDDALFLVSGCLTKINPIKLAEIFQGEAFSKDGEDRLDEIIHAKISINDIFWDGDIVREHSLGDPFLHYSQDELDELKVANTLGEKFKKSTFLDIYNYTTKGRFFWKEDDLFEVKVADGCKYNCSYCATKKAKGVLKSRPVDKILDETVFGFEKGYTKFVLTGDEVGEFGWDIETDLADLIKKMIPLIGNSKIAIRYITPEALIKLYKELKPFFEDGRVYYFCASFQSGSKKVLKAMNRPQNVEKLVAIIKELDEKCPKVYKHTQIIVGFPGETKKDFEMTLKTLEAAKFDYITVTKYSDRPDTVASQMNGHISDTLIDERYKEARKLVAKLRSAKLKEKFFREIATP